MSLTRVRIALTGTFMCPEAVLNANEKTIERYLARAVELRREAEHIDDSHMRELLLSTAEAYENMAAWQRWAASPDNPAFLHQSALDPIAAKLRPSAESGESIRSRIPSAVRRG